MGGAWPLSPETHESIAKWVADVCGRYDIPIDRNRVMGHREVYIRHGASYATACPGGMDLDWIVSRARAIAGLGGSPAPIVVHPPSAPANGTFNGYPIREIQRLLGIHGFSTSIDGIYGPDTRSKVRAFQASVGVGVDGVVGPVTWGRLTQLPASTPKPQQDTTYNGYSVRQIQTMLTQRGFATTVDGIYGPQTGSQVRAFQRSQGVAADGIVGPVTWSRLNTPHRPAPPAPKPRQTLRRGSVGDDVRYLQQRLGGLTVDGVFGSATERAVKAFQRKERITVDGIVGPVTWSRLG